MESERIEVFTSSNICSANGSLLRESLTANKSLFSSSFMLLLLCKIYVESSENSTK